MKYNGREAIINFEPSTYEGKIIVDDKGTQGSNRFKPSFIQYFKGDFVVAFTGTKICRMNFCWYEFRKWTHS